MNIQRDNNGFAHIVSLSGGKDSTAMALRLAEIEARPYTFVCTPTGDELPIMFEHWLNLGELLGSKLWPISGSTLKKVCEEENALPNFRMRFCTRRLKIEPFKRFLLMAAPAVSYVGLRADETDREGIDHGGNIKLDIADVVHQDYPLQRWGWDLVKVINYLRDREINIPYRTDCARCYHQTIGEWWLLYKDHQDIFDDAINDEVASGHTYRTPGRDTWPTDLLALKAAFDSGLYPKNAAQIDLFDSRSSMCRACTL